jgi:hypothetical protein
MKLLCSILLSSAVSFTQVSSSLPPRPFAAAASEVSAQVVWFEAIGRLENGETSAAFTALAVMDPEHLGHQLRGLRVDLAMPDWKGVVYVEESAIGNLKKHADWLAKMAKLYPKETGPFSDRGEFDDPAPPLYFEYRGAGREGIVYLGGPGLRMFQFTGSPPSDLAAIFARAVKALRAH